MFIFIVIDKASHEFRPIQIEATDIEQARLWVLNNLDDTISWHIMLKPSTVQLFGIEYR